MDSNSVVIVRGSKRGLDPAYACMSHNGSSNNYVALHFGGDGALRRREIVPASNRSQLEEFTAKGNFRGTVYADNRKDNGLLPLKVGKHCLPVDFALFRRAKSDSEIADLDSLNRSTRRLLSQKNVDKNSFRGTSDVKSAFTSRICKGFAEYRGGLKDSLGRMTDLTHVEAKTPEWESRLQRAYRGFDAVQRMLTPGRSISELNKTFMSFMDPTKDRVYGNVVGHTAYEGREENVPLEELHEYDYLKVGLAVGDARGKEVALLYRSTAAVQPPPPPPKMTHTSRPVAPATTPDPPPSVPVDKSPPPVRTISRPEEPRVYEGSAIATDDAVATTNARQDVGPANEEAARIERNRMRIKGLL